MNIFIWKWSKSSYKLLKETWNKIINSNIQKPTRNQNTNSYELIFFIVISKNTLVEYSQSESLCLNMQEKWEIS